MQAANPMPQKRTRLLDFIGRVLKLPSHNASERPEGASMSLKGLIKAPKGLVRGYAQTSEVLLIVDGSTWQHLPKFLLWLALEFTQIALCSYQYYHCEFASCLSCVP